MTQHKQSFPEVNQPRDVQVIHYWNEYNRYGND